MTNIKKIVGLSVLLLLVSMLLNGAVFDKAKFEEELKDFELILSDPSSQDSIKGINIRFKQIIKNLTDNIIKKYEDRLNKLLFCIKARILIREYEDIVNNIEIKEKEINDLLEAHTNLIENYFQYLSSTIIKKLKLNIKDLAEKNRIININKLRIDAEQVIENQGDLTELYNTLSNLDTKSVLELKELIYKVEQTILKQNIDKFVANWDKKLNIYKNIKNIDIKATILDEIYREAVQIQINLKFKDKVDPELFKITNRYLAIFTKHIEKINIIRSQNTKEMVRKYQKWALQKIIKAESDFKYADDKLDDKYQENYVKNIFSTKLMIIDLKLLDNEVSNIYWDVYGKGLEIIEDVDNIKLILAKKRVSVKKKGFEIL